MKRVLFWGRFDPGYSRNRVYAALFRELGWEVDYFFVKVWPRFGDVEAFLRGLWARPAVEPAQPRLHVAEAAAPLYVEVVDFPSKLAEGRRVYAVLGIAVVEPTPEKDSLRHSLCCG